MKTVCFVSIVLFALAMPASLVAQVSKPAVSPISKSAGRELSMAASVSTENSTGWKHCDTAGLETCATNRPSCCAKVEATTAFTDKSLYQLESKWTTDTGRQIQLASLKGRPQVVVMFFACCQNACPILVHDLQRIEAALKPELRAQVGFTLVTIDPRRDTIEALAQFREMRNLSSDTWTLLRGGDDDILELAALLGVKYKQEANGQFAHSNVITVLNRDGEIVHQLVGLGQDIDATVRELEKVLAE